MDQQMVMSVRVTNERKVDEIIRWWIKYGMTVSLELFVDRRSDINVRHVRICFYFFLFVLLIYLQFPEKNFFNFNMHNYCEYKYEFSFSLRGGGEVLVLTLRPIG